MTESINLNEVIEELEYILFGESGWLNETKSVEYRLKEYINQLKELKRLNND